MSVYIYSNVLYLKMPAHRKLVLAVLADHANERGDCWPSQALLAHRATISIRKLRDHLRGLEKDGWLRTFIGQGRGGVNVYQLNVSKITDAARIEKERIAKEKEQYLLNLSETQSEGPDFEDTTPDSEDIPQDIQNINPGL